ncbi:hypothetical protein HanIR_Chr16g0801771 [Helianthus annuus]|nr:hypothetical protein HanIR_Chr16g0801771 [Helianthus annuus]
MLNASVSNDSCSGSSSAIMKENHKTNPTFTTSHADLLWLFQSQISSGYTDLENTQGFAGLKVVVATVSSILVGSVFRFSLLSCTGLLIFVSINSSISNLKP